MKLRKLIHLSLAFSIPCLLQAQQAKMNIGIEAGQLNFGISFKGRPVIMTSPLGMNIDNRLLGQEIKSTTANTTSEKYKTYAIEQKDGNIYYIDSWEFDNGVALRYRIPTNGPRCIYSEQTSYTFPSGTHVWYASGPFQYGWIQAYQERNTDSIKNELLAPPATFLLPDGTYAAITEANLFNFHGAVLFGKENNRVQFGYVENKGHMETGIITGLPPAKFYHEAVCDVPWIVSPRKGENEIVTPWRVLMLADDLNGLVNNQIIAQVSDKPNPALFPKGKDTEWIKPGMVSWIYWAYNHGSQDYQIVKEYIDLAVKMKWSYDLIDWEWDVMRNGGNIQDAVKYSLSQGVKPLVWYNSSTNWIGPGPLFRLNKKADREKEYKWLSDMGVAGIKVDFFSGDSVSTMNYYIDLLEDAVKYKLMLNFHGATIPRGWQRTYPHMMSVEGVYGAEWYNNTPVLTNRAAEHNATLPFTRNVVGPMDYTPGTFSDSQHPHITSYGHELALPIIFESALQHMPDRPSVYYDMPEPVKKLLSDLPAAWDDTKLLTGYPGMEVVMARRKGDVWYIAGINGTNEPRTLCFSLKDLSVAGKKITLFEDGTDDRSFTIEENLPLSEDEMTLEIKCLPRGGFVAVIK
mgnify:CR=1 FL=1